MLVDWKDKENEIVWVLLPVIYVWVDEVGGEVLMY